MNAIDGNFIKLFDLNFALIFVLFCFSSFVVYFQEHMHMEFRDIADRTVQYDLDD